MIGGERGKGRPCWIYDVMGWSGIGGEGGKVGHVGLGGGCDVMIYAQIRGAVNQSEESGTGSKNVKKFYLARKICLS